MKRSRVWRFFRGRLRRMRDSWLLNPNWARVRVVLGHMVRPRSPRDSAAPEEKSRGAVLDIHLGYSEAQSDFGYDLATIGTSSKRNSQALRVLTLGGSTTSWRYKPDQGGMWAKDLATMLSEVTLQRVELSNGGVRGYSSAQELLKLVRDIQALRPDLILSLSGINDIGHRHSVSNFPFAHPQAYENARLFVRRGDFSEIVMGWPNRLIKPDVWMHNQRAMAAVAQTHNSSFFGFLQPTMGVGNATLGPAEKQEWSENRSRPLDAGSYEGVLLDFYSSVQPRLPEGRVFDLSSAFDGESEVFLDFRHQNRKGDRFLARAMLEQIRIEGFF